MREDKIAQRGVLQCILTKYFSDDQIEDDEIEKNVNHTYEKWKMCIKFWSEGLKTSDNIGGCVCVCVCVCARARK
jgi:hypothetical protein